MGGEQAANVLLTVKQDRLAKKGESMTEEEAFQFKKPILEDYERRSSSVYSSARLWDDGIIDPADTRKVLGIALSLNRYSKIKEPKTGIFRM